MYCEHEGVSIPYGIFLLCKQSRKVNSIFDCWVVFSHVIHIQFMSAVFILFWVLCKGTRREAIDRNGNVSQFYSDDTLYFLDQL